MARQEKHNGEKVRLWEYGLIALIWLLAISLAVILIAKVRFALNQ